MTAPIHTERLILRPFTLDDAEDHYAYFHLPEVAAYVPWEPGDRDTALEWLTRRSNHGIIDGFHDRLFLAVEFEGRVVGEVMLAWSSRDHGQGEIGFAFHPSAQGKSIAYEASREMLRVGFESQRMHRIFGRCDAENTASARLMERLGMRREAHLRENEFFKGRWSDELDYAILASEWPPS